MTDALFSVCVYCGSRNGESGLHAESAAEVGRLIGERGWRLVYGGGRAGLMGVVADAALAAGAPVLGVIPQSLVDREVAHAGLTELRVVSTMHQRKQAMAEAADVFLALPGGIGTFEELFEVWTWRQLGYHDKPVGLLNSGGYYDGLIELPRPCRAQRLHRSRPARPAAGRDRRAPNCCSGCTGRRASAVAPDDYRRI